MPSVSRTFSSADEFFPLIFLPQMRSRGNKVMRVRPFLLFFFFFSLSLVRGPQKWLICLPFFPVAKTFPCYKTELSLGDNFSCSFLTGTLFFYWSHGFRRVFILHYLGYVSVDVFKLLLSLASYGICSLLLVPFHGEYFERNVDWRTNTSVNCKARYLTCLYRIRQR